MSTYDVRCNSCGEEFEITKKMVDPIPNACEKCGVSFDGVLSQVITTSKFSLKGEGWSTDPYNKV